MKKKHAYTARTTRSRLITMGWIVSSALLPLSVAQAARITEWNLDNVTTEIPPYILGEVYNSFVYTDASKTVTNGGIVWVESDVQTPGMKVVTDGDGNQGPESCIMTAGANRFRFLRCPTPKKTGKRKSPPHFPPACCWAGSALRNLPS